MEKTMEVKKGAIPFCMLPIAIGLARSISNLDKGEPVPHQLVKVAEIICGD